MVSIGVVSVKGAKRRIQKRRRSQKRRGLQHGSRHRSRSRKPMAKKRKTSDQGKHRPMKRRRRASKRSLRSDAGKQKGAKGSVLFLSRQAKALMILIVEDIYKQALREAERLRRESRRAVLSPMRVPAALRTAMPKRRRKQAAFRHRH